MANLPSAVVVFFFLVLLRACSCIESAPPSSVLAFEKSLGYLRRQRAPPALQLAAARGVLGRLLPNHSSSFEFAVISEDQCGGKDCFLLSNIDSEGQDPEISVSGSSGVDILAGLHWYLKYWCGGHVSWKKTGGSQLGSVPKPGTLPRVHDAGIRVQRPVPWSYYQNVVTASYSSVWWDWKRWEEEIDWMALQGINLPLAFTGQETIWVKVFEKFNLTKADLNEFFGGPAFLAWARMGNLHAWGGPLPQSWLDDQLALQKKILTRMFQLGMMPVLPAFSGNVPAALQSIFPSANITQLGEWNTVNGDERWCCTYLLDPDDELFIRIGKAFVLEQIKEYGWTSHIYNCDTFNENEPPSNDTSYISSLGAGVYEAMKAGDEEAIWLMQGWLFSSDSSFWQPPQMQALLHSVPIGKMVVLDLFAEVKPIWQSSNHFYGVPYIWCMLHNFGGNIEMYGALDTVGSGPIQAKRSPNSTMVGVGMCMEGIEQNPVVYELMAEMAFRKETVNIEEWIKLYASRRYGRTTGGAQKAWQTLHQTIYNCTDGIADHNTDVIVKLPDLNPTTDVLDEVPGHLWYTNEGVGRALQDLLNDSTDLAYMSTYRYDVTDLTRQFLAKQANQIYYDMILAYQSGDYKGSIARSNLLVDLISDMEVLLASNECFLLGDWLESAKALAIDENQLERYEWNARTQVTMWFDNTNDTPSPLRDYANHYMSGLVGDYYLPRATLYAELLCHSMDNNVPFPFGEWRKQWIALTNSWQASNNIYPTRPKGDTIQIATSLSNKYTSSTRVYPLRIKKCFEL